MLPPRPGAEPDRSTGGDRRRSPRQRWTALVACGLVAVLVVAGVVAWRQTPSQPASAATAGASQQGSTDPADEPTETAAAPARRLATVVRPETPSSATLPDGRVVPVEPVSTTRGGTLDVPEDIRTAGWWRGGSRIGDPFGSILVAGHIDSTAQGLGPFAQLLSVRPGQRIRVGTAHLRQDFTIRARTLVPQGSLARQRWIFAATGRPRLTLVTCAPPFVRNRGGYQNLAVVTAVPTGDPVRR